jgi:hypothetical protein
LWEVDEDGNKAANKNKMSKRKTIKTSSSSALPTSAESTERDAANEKGTESAASSAREYGGVRFLNL